MKKLQRVRTRRQLLRATAVGAASIPFLALARKSAPAGQGGNGQGGPCFLKGTKISTPSGDRLVPPRTAICRKTNLNVYISNDLAAQETGPPARPALSPIARGWHGCADLGPADRTVFNCPLRFVGGPAPLSPMRA